MEKGKLWCSPGFYTGSLIVLDIYQWPAKDHRQICRSILFADDTSIIIANTNVHEYKHNIKVAIHEINNWFVNNLLTVNFDKTYFLQFFTKKKNYHYK